MTKFNLFSEIYGCYFSVVNSIIEKAQEGLTREEIENIVESQGFYDSAFYLVPKLLAKEWSFLEDIDGKYYVNKNLNILNRPLTNLEMAWLKAILTDKRIVLFLSKEEIIALCDILKDTEPLFQHSDFYYTDLALDGDDYENELYQSNFKLILEACKLNTPLAVDYENSKGKGFTNIVLPYKITYSSKDDKFRFICLAIQQDGSYRQVTLNVSRILKIEFLEKDLHTDIDVVKEIHNTLSSEPITISISTKRRALERCMLQFASWEKETEYDEKTDRYICKIYYNKQEETELLIRILSFGPVIKVLGHESFLQQVKERVFKQYELNKA